MGLSTSDQGERAFRWENNAMVDLGWGEARAVSGDGSVVVGEWGDAWLWDSTNGRRDVKQVLEDEFSLDLTGWSLKGVYDVSEDGTIIVGYGTNPQGTAEAWRAVVPRAVPSQILYREANDASWGFGADGIPGWDHVGFYHDHNVYECHPGYPTGKYWDPLEFQWVPIISAEGVQASHTLGSFLHDAQNLDTNAASVTVPVDPERAVAMKEFIQTVAGEPFVFLCVDTSDIACWQVTLHPNNQKGYDGNGFTCVGLVERASEEADPVGDGIIPEELESFDIPSFGLFPMLSPVFQHWVASGQVPESPTSWMMGFLDPVDFIVTDPMGRRFGFVAGEGEVNEIPGALFSGDGDVEQFIIPNPIPGEYQIELCGLGEDVNAAFGGTLQGHLYQGFLEKGEVDTVMLSVPVVANQFNVVQGFQVEGDLSDTKSSDDSYLKFEPGITLFPTEPPVWLEFDGTIDLEEPASLRVTLEATANTVGLSQTVEMFNWNSGQYDLVDQQAASFNSDSVITADVTADISDYVETRSGAVKTRVGWKQDGLVLLFPWTISIDQVAWSIDQ